MRNPSGHDGFRQDGTDKRLIDTPHICAFPAHLSSPKTEFPPPPGRVSNGGLPAVASALVLASSGQHQDETGEDGTDLIWSRMGLEVRPALETMRARRPSLIMARIKVLDERTFRPKKRGQWAVTVGVNNRDSQLVDICAFFLHDPAQWWLQRRSQTPVLGADRIDYAAFHQQILPLYQTPYDWLLERGNGAVVVDWGCDPRDIFEGVPEIQCQSLSLAKKLRQSYAKFQPRIIAPTKEKRHAT